VKAAVDQFTVVGASRSVETARVGFTMNYSQPDDYHFCQDSVLFPKFVAEQLRGRSKIGSAEGAEFRALDVCAGCGVLGLELSHYLPLIENFDFLEIQSVFRPHFHENLTRAGRSAEKYRFIEANYAGFLDTVRFQSSADSPSTAPATRYDLIIANPPYFEAEEGHLSPSPVKNRCRFFLDSDLKTLVQGIGHALKPGGQAFLLMKSGEKHGRRLDRDLQLWLAGSASVEIVGEIRGTSVVRISL
jgi:tRNA1Val (adenine37-N6)-methyltransferase